MTNHKIHHIQAHQILDCRGYPTLEVEVTLANDVKSSAQVPSGKSTGKHEAFELRDKTDEYNGMNVKHAINNVNKIINPKLIGHDVREQNQIDNMMIELDGTENKEKLGANAIIGVSLAIARAAASSLGIPLYKYLGGENANTLPIPFLSLINGGKLAGTDLEFQEFFIVPSNAESVSEALRKGTEVYYSLSKILINKFGKSLMSTTDEGGFALPIHEPHEALDFLEKAIIDAGYEGQFKFALDVAASHFYDYKKNMYILNNKELNQDDMFNLYTDLVSKYDLVSIEDPLEQDDFHGFTELTKTLNIQIIGDDFLVTNINRLKKAMQTQSANAILLKVNQIGTLSESLNVAKYALDNNYAVQVSERSGETEDNIISDIAVALNCCQMKAGAPARSERTSKYNRLLKIEQELGINAKYPTDFFI